MHTESFNQINNIKSSPMLDYERWVRSWSRFLGSQPSGDTSHKLYGSRLQIMIV